MTDPRDDDRPAPRIQDVHLRLADRGTALLPEPRDSDGRMTLTDAMLAIATLACCLGLFRQSIVPGAISLILVVPSVARTHVVMIRRRDLGLSTTAWTWLLSFAASVPRAGLTLGACSIAYGIGVGGAYGIDLLAGGKLTRDTQTIVYFCGFATATLATFLVLIFVAPRILEVREEA